jgi:hypothetical protein
MRKALARLRAKTDRELCILAGKQLEQTLRFVEAGNREEAMASYEAAQRLLTVTQLSTLNREPMEQLLARTEAALELDKPTVAAA